MCGGWWLVGGGSWSGARVEVGTQANTSTQTHQHKHKRKRRSHGHTQADKHKQLQAQKHTETQAKDRDRTTRKHTDRHTDRCPHTGTKQQRANEYCFSVVLPALFVSAKLTVEKPKCRNNWAPLPKMVSQHMGRNHNRSPQEIERDIKLVATQTNM